MDITEVLHSSDAVLDAFYPGQFGATAIAEAIFGKTNPAGKLPYTHLLRSIQGYLGMRLCP